MNIKPDRLICVEGLIRNIYIWRTLPFVNEFNLSVHEDRRPPLYISQMEGISSRDFPHKRGEITHKYISYSIWAVGNETLITANI